MTTVKNTPIAIVAGMGKQDRAIGKENGLLWHIPDDMKRFAALTRGKPVVMGRKTFESILEISGGPLSGRPNIVVTRNPTYVHATATIVGSLEDGLVAAAEFDAEEIHIGGGPELYNQVLPMVTRLYLTFFHEQKEGDAFFPEFESDFRAVKQHSAREHEGLKYEWIDYVRIAA